MQRVRQQGSVLFCYNAVRPLGEDFEESVGYNFTFLEGGRMTMEGGISWDFSGSLRPLLSMSISEHV